MESKRNSGATSFFQMPLHYPRYAKKDYLNMPEWQLDALLAQYGLPTEGDLSWKREYAMGAFLWPNTREEPRNSSACYGFENSSAFNKRSKMVEFVYRVFGYA